MPITTFTKSDLKNSDFRTQVATTRNTRIVAGKVVKNTSSNDAKVLKTTQFLQTNGTMEPQGASVSTNDVSMRMLESLGICVMTGDEINNKDYSLLSTIDLEILDNPNISEPDKLLKLTNKKTTATDKFVDPNDPFYVLDETPSRAYQKKTAEVTQKMDYKDCVSIAAAFYDLNVINTSEMTLKQFSK
jgi:hypothetical protein